ncbi:MULTISPECIES: glycoside hydrolase family 3 protein [unclassified Rathayibacter]|uniref:glycoside hydrolase family 3 protein n=1 Tax=unclassified Rathayibacter TaxID=2609250 RepID=UPI000CE8D0D3|nr:MULTISPECIES: glycoside hydrolase family 3 N-terminal domain-containing protein [unclassified Rathayibacter]PPI41690.1 beta-glucosidase [Rathayibacter sp. RFBD1]PPI63191.1 beta-glucosidase [Rathayibacter sp. TRS19]
MARDSQTAPDGAVFRDLNGNGVMDPFEDPRLTPEQRADDLLPRLSLAEKAGLLFHTVISSLPAGDHDSTDHFLGGSHREVVGSRFLNHFNVGRIDDPVETAAWQNALQELAAAAPHGIPITFSSDPRHGFAQNEGMAFRAGAFSEWPEFLGLAALGDPDLVRSYAETVREEYLAVGIRAALHPQVDLATEPRWARQLQTFGADSRLASELVTAYLGGMQGDALGPDGVACTTKHFPGGGPQKDGEDPHFPYGREQVYPGGRFEEHLAPFRAAVAAGTSAIMPYYALPSGLVLDGEPVEEVGFAYNRRIITGLLREELGYDGVVLTDWALVTDLEIGGLSWPAKAWGVEHLSRVERVLRILEAGADQFGGEASPDLVVELVESGRVSVDRLDESVRRLLLVKFRLGLFDDPFVDESRVADRIGAPAAVAAGRRAQSRSVVVLENDGVLPLARGRRLHVVGVDPAVAGEYGEVVDDPADADLAIVRLAAPFEPRSQYFLEEQTHQGSLDFPAGDVDRVLGLAARLPVVLDVHLDRAAILTPFSGAVAALTADFGVSDRALLHTLVGDVAAEGRLPVELPRSMAAVEASRPDVPSDTVDPLHRHGAGIRLPRSEDRRDGSGA